MSLRVKLHCSTLQREKKGGFSCSDWNDFPLVAPQLEIASKVRKCFISFELQGPKSSAVNLG